MSKKQEDLESLLIKLVYNCSYLTKGKCRFGGNNEEPIQCCFACSENERCFEGIDYNGVALEKCVKGYIRCFRYQKWREQHGWGE